MILHLYPYPCLLTLKLVKSLPDDVGGLVEYDKGNQITMKLTLKDWEKYIVHESCHAVQAVEKYIEHKLDDESEAYMLQFITDNIKKYITKRQRKKKNGKTNFKRSETSSTLEKIQKRLDKGRNRKKLRCSH